jgi:hypothetical protein
MCTYGEAFKQAYSQRCCCCCRQLGGQEPHVHLRRGLQAGILTTLLLLQATGRPRT